MRSFPEKFSQMALRGGRTGPRYNSTRPEMRARGFITPQYGRCYPPNRVPIVPRRLLPAEMNSAPVAKNTVENFHSVCQIGELAWRKPSEICGEILDAHLTAFLQQVRAFCSGADLPASRILGIALDLNQPAAREACDDAAHRRRLDLFGRSQFAQCFRACEDEDGERGEARRAFPGSDGLPAHAPQQVDRRRVQTVGYREDVGIANLRRLTMKLRVRGHMHCHSSRISGSLPDLRISHNCHSERPPMPASAERTRGSDRDFCRNAAGGEQIPPRCRSSE